MSSEEPPAKRRKQVQWDEYGGTTCLCCDQECDNAMKKLKKYNPERHAYFRIPSEPGDAKGGIRKSQVESRERKSQKRRRMLAALPQAASVRANDELYSNPSSP